MAREKVARESERMVLMNNIVLQFDKLVAICREVEVGDNDLQVRVAYLYPMSHEYSPSRLNVSSKPSG